MALGTSRLGTGIPHGSSGRDEATRAVPILLGDMRDGLQWAHEQSEGCEQVFNRQGSRSRNSARGRSHVRLPVPDLKFHDMRRTAVRNMRRAGVSHGT
jgi:hypothetical protein